MQEVADAFSAACSAFGLTISTKKKELVFQPPPNYSGILHPTIEIDNVKINTVDKFTYLGSTVTIKKYIKTVSKINSVGLAMLYECPKIAPPRSFCAVSSPKLQERLAALY